MTVPPSEPSNVGANRRALVEQLIELRVAAGLSGNALAKRMGIVQSRMSKIQSYDLMPTEGDIEAWAQETGQPERTEELKSMLAEAKRERLFANELRRQGGVAGFEQSVHDVEREHTRLGEFQVAVIPGPLQTADYARALLTVPTGPAAWSADEAAIEAKISERLRRQEILYDRGKRIQIVVTEGALRTMYGAVATQIGQMDKLVSLSRLPSVELGIIDFRRKLPVHPWGFRIYDDDLVVSESLTDEKSYTVRDNPEQIAAYLEAFNELRQASVTGNEAEAIIQNVIEDLLRLAE